MIYQNTDTKLDQLIGYFNEQKINLSPIFQRGRVWPLKMRKELLKNIIRKRPIPAIFLYKDEAGAKFSYNILDGKQRLESILMFIGGDNPDLKIKTWANYIFDAIHRKKVGFPVDLKDERGARKFANFDEAEIRELREYKIPTIEIELDETTTLDEIISLFVDINQYGAKVTRLDIVKAIKRKDPLLEGVFAMVAQRERRRQDVFVKRRKTAFSSVLKRLQIISSVSDPSAQADRMWEKLFELALFVRSGGTHRKPTEILKTFIRTAEQAQQSKLTRAERKKLAGSFEFLRDAYKSSNLGETRLATDQTHFYIMITSLLSSGLLTEPDLIRKLISFAKLISAKSTSNPNMQKYMELSSKQTTDAEKRKERQRLFVEIVRGL